MAMKKYTLNLSNCVLATNYSEARMKFLHRVLHEDYYELNNYKTRYGQNAMLSMKEDDMHFDEDTVDAKAKLYHFELISYIEGDTYSNAYDAFIEKIRFSYLCKKFRNLLKVSDRLAKRAVSVSFFFDKKDKEKWLACSKCFFACAEVPNLVSGECSFIERWMTETDDLKR